MANQRYMVIAKHFRYTDPTKPEKIEYDYEQAFFFNWDGEILTLEGSSWQIKVNNHYLMTEHMRKYFSRLNYHVVHLDLCKT